MKDLQESSELTRDACKPSIPDSSAVLPIIPAPFHPAFEDFELIAPLEDGASSLDDTSSTLFSVEFSRFWIRAVVAASSTQKSQIDDMTFTLQPEGKAQQSV